MSDQSELLPVYTAPDVQGVARIVGGVGGIGFQWEELDRGEHIVRAAARELRQVEDNVAALDVRISALQMLSVVSGSATHSSSIAAGAASEGLRTCRQQISHGCSDLEQVADNVARSRLQYELAEAATRNFTLEALTRAADRVFDSSPFLSRPLTVRHIDTADISLDGSVDSLLAEVPHAGDQPDGAFEVLEIPDSSGPRYVVILPGTEAAGDPEHPFSAVGIAEAKMADSRYVNDAVTRALAEVGAEPGAGVVLVGYSQGGMHAMNLANSGGLAERYSVEAVITAGSPVDGEAAPQHTRFLHLAHEDDAVPALDVPHVADQANQVSVVLDHSTEPYAGDSNPAHDIESYRQGAQAVDVSNHASILPVTAAISAATASASAKRHVFAVTRPPLTGDQRLVAPGQDSRRMGRPPLA